MLRGARSSALTMQSLLRRNVLQLQKIQQTLIRSISTAPPAPKEEKKDFISRLFPVKYAQPGFNRWFMVPAAVGTHLCLGSVYSWSLYNEPLTNFYGVVGRSSQDWKLSQVVPLFTLILVLQGLSAAAAGKWQQKVGGRGAAFVGACCFGGGHVMAGLSCFAHFLPGMYLGYGLIAGSGIGISYTPPMTMLLAWFKERPGLATGMTVMGFGGGAMVFGPITNMLLKKFSVDPTRLGSASELSLITDAAGRRMVQIGSEMKEVIEVSSKELASSSVFAHLQEGVYLVGSGSTGVAETLTVLGASYLTIMATSALSYRLPAPVAAAATAGQAAHAPEKYVPVDIAFRSQQYWRMWTVFGCLAAAGLSIASVAKTMMKEIFGSTLPDIVTPAFAGAYVFAFSFANLTGRLFWSGASDVIGVRNVFLIFTAASIPAYLMIPQCVNAVTASPSLLPLAVFYGSTLFAVTIFGGGYATTPAYEANIFGTKEVGAIHGRMLTASAAASVLGPNAITRLRAHERSKAIDELATKVSPEDFEAKFGAPISALNDLVNTGTVTIQNLLTLCPEGTADPTPFLYNSTMYCAAGLLGLAAIANLGIKPMPKHAFYIDGKPIAEWEKLQTANLAEKKQKKKKKVWGPNNLRPDRICI
eukprot:g57501.t1